MIDDPEPLVRALRERLSDIVLDIRRDLPRTDDPQCAALLTTAAEVMAGLSKAFRDFEQNSEPAWRKLSRRVWP